MISTRKIPYGALAVVGVCVLIGLGIWWIKRPRKPAMAMESMVSYFVKWTDDIVREKVHVWIKDQSEASPEEMQGAAEIISGVECIDLYRKAVEGSPDDPALHAGLIRAYCGSVENAPEVVIGGGASRNEDPVSTNWNGILDELKRMAELDPQNAAVDYLQAYLDLRSHAVDGPTVLTRLEEAGKKPSFDDYGLDGARKSASLLVKTGLSETEAGLAMIRTRSNPLREIWPRLGELLERLGRSSLADQDNEGAERAFNVLIALGDRLVSMEAWLDENLSGYEILASGLACLGELREKQGQESEARACEAQAQEAKVRRQELEACQINVPHMDPGASHEDRMQRREEMMTRGNDGIEKLMALTGPELDQYLQAYLSHGAGAADPLLKAASSGATTP